jgi:hypothetical protein
MMLPPLPPTLGYGYDWMERLSGGWYVVSIWGSDGWNAGDWPLVILVHYDNDDAATYGMAVYTEGDLDIKEFKTRQERDQATNEWAVWWWNFSETEGAPKKLSDGRLGSYRYYG